MFLLGFPVVAQTARADPAPVRALRAGVAWDHLDRRDGGPRDGASAYVAFRQSLADDWDAWAKVSWGGLPRPGQRPADLLCAAAGVALVLDAADWTPALHVGAGFLGSVATRALPPDGTALAGVTLDWRPHPRVQVGLLAEARIPFRSYRRFPVMTSVGAHAALTF